MKKSLFLIALIILSGCGSFSKKKIDNKEMDFSISTRGEFVFGDERQDPATDKEFIIINKIINAINTGDAGRDEWWEREFKIRHTIKTLKPDEESSESKVTLY